MIQINDDTYISKLQIIYIREMYDAFEIVTMTDTFKVEKYDNDGDYNDYYDNIANLLKG